MRLLIMVNLLFVLQFSYANSNLKDPSDCEYTSDVLKFHLKKFGEKARICVAGISCKFTLDNNDFRVVRSYQTVCSALDNGMCPVADKCAADRSIVEEGIGSYNMMKTLPLAPVPNSRSRSRGIR